MEHGEEWCKKCNERLSNCPNLIFRVLADGKGWRRNGTKG